MQSMDPFASDKSSHIWSGSAPAFSCAQLQGSPDGAPQAPTTAITVADFAPEWDYTQGGSKLLLSGDFDSSHRLNVLVDGVKVTFISLSSACPPPPPPHPASAALNRALGMAGPPRFWAVSCPAEGHHQLCCQRLESKWYCLLMSAKLL